jgi:hypothetical protein
MELTPSSVPPPPRVVLPGLIIVVAVAFVVLCVVVVVVTTAVIVAVVGVLLSSPPLSSLFVVVAMPPSLAFCCHCRCRRHQPSGADGAGHASSAGRQRRSTKRGETGRWKSSNEGQQESKDADRRSERHRNQEMGGEVNESEIHVVNCAEQGGCWHGVW